MKNILIVSEMTPQAPCGVVTYYQKIIDQFSGDPETKVWIATAADGSFWDKKIAGLIRRIISLFSFIDKRIAMYADDLFYRLLIRGALRKYKGKNIDYIHAQEPRSAYHAKRYFKGSVPVILTCHFNDNPVEEDILFYEVEKPELKQYLTKKSKVHLTEIDSFVFVSKYCYEKTKHLLNSTSEIFVIHNGVDLATLSDEVNEETRGNKIEIINTGHIEKRKNQKLLVSIAEELIKNAFTDFHMTILGIGPDLPALKEMIQNRGLGGYFSLPGWVNNVNDYLDKADLYIHTSSNDNCPYSVIESIARKTPVLGFKVGGLSEILDESFLFELNDVKAIARFVIENIDKFDLMANEQFSAIETEFSIQYQFDQLKQLYSTAKPKQILHPVEGHIN